MSDTFFDRVLAPGDLSVRGDGRTIYGLVAPFDQEARVSDGGRPYVEVFRRGAFAKTISERGDKVKLLVNHDRQRLPIGRSTHLEERSDGLYGEFRVSATDQGNTALELVRDGVLDSFSVGFAPIQHRGSPTSVVERTEVALRETSVVAFPAYAGAAIGGVRFNEGGAVPGPESVVVSGPIVPPLDRDELVRLLNLYFGRDSADLRTLIAEAAAGTSADGAATQQDNEPAHATRCLPKHTRQLLLRQLREDNR